MNAGARPEVSLAPATGALGLRPMALDDLEAVMAIEVQAYPWPWSRGNFADTLAAGHWAQVLVDPDQAILGYIVAMSGAGELHLLNVTVIPSHQGRGLGRGLLERLEDEARIRGVTEIWLEVRASNLRARALYARLGYHEVGLRRQYYPGPPGRREDAILMSRPLQGERGASGCTAAFRDGVGRVRGGTAAAEVPHGD
jgi:ribosomal-protein-alanine N-acetyltransferase